MAFYLSALGYTIDRDGWRFQPIAETKFDLRCRGQVIPASKELTYEVFVEEVHDGPVPKLYADLLCTVDGLGAFHARRFGLELTPSWPLTDRPELMREGKDDPRAAVASIRTARPSASTSPRSSPAPGASPRPPSARCTSASTVTAARRACPARPTTS